MAYTRIISPLDTCTTGEQTCGVLHGHLAIPNWSNHVYSERLFDRMTSPHLLSSSSKLARRIIFARPIFQCISSYSFAEISISSAMSCQNSDLRLKMSVLGRNFVGNRHWTMIWLHTACTTSPLWFASRHRLVWYAYGACMLCSWIQYDRVAAC